MNANHALCATREWSEHIRDDVVSYVAAHADLGESMLEIGPGPGAATEWLRHEVKHLVALELDDDAAAALALRYAGANVEVVVGDGSRLGYRDGQFDAVGCFTMLHHVATIDGQDAIFAEAHRVLRAGGVFVGSDSLPSEGLRDFHEGDTYNPVEPGSLFQRLRSAGFGAITVVVDDITKFIAHKPDPAPAPYDRR